MVNIAIMGMGVVGGGVADIVLNNADLLSEKIGCTNKNGIKVKYVLDLRSFEGHPLESAVTNDINKIINDKEVSIVVEAMGGLHPAYEFTKLALESGKSVVTPNKAVVSAFGPELLKIAKENGVSYLYEASVGGGIPIIRPLMNCLAGNNILSVFGILNGTTNYILTEMKRNGTAFTSALEDAQNKGYAESDPTADISGGDTCRKICILANIAYDTFVLPETVHCEGIEDISTEYLALADKLGYNIKLIGSAFVEDGKLAIFTAPAALHEENVISSIDGVYNAVSVNGDNVGDLLFCGQGAGALPTASAIVGDIVDIIRFQPKPKLWNQIDAKPLLSYDDISSEYFVCVDGAASNDDLFEVFGRTKIVLGEDSKAFIAPKCALKSQKEKLDTLEKKGVRTLANLRVIEA